MILIVNTGIALFGFDFNEVPPDRRITLVTLVALGIGGIVGLFVFLREARGRIDETPLTFEPVLDAGQVTRRQMNLPEATIRCSEIRQLEECAGKWLKIKGGPGQSSITVSSDVENYQQLKADLVSLSGVPISVKGPGPILVWAGLFTIATLALIVISLIATNRLVAVIASFTLVALVVVP